MFEAKSQHILRDILNYFDEHKETATADAYHWRIGKFVFWIANGESWLDLDSKETIPKEIFKHLKKDIYEYYQKWLESDYKCQTPNKKEAKMVKCDLSKLKVGSRVTFVADESNKNSLSNGNPTMVMPSQIISIEPPVFEWADARPGMRFEYGRSKSVCRYVGPDLDATERVIVLFDDGELTWAPKSSLTPAPEE